MSIGFGMGFDLVSTLFPILFALFFVVFLGLLVYTLVRSAGQWRRNNQSPVLTVEAQVVTKRSDVSYHDTGDTGMRHSHMSYYATFQVESGDRMELPVSGQEYGLLVEGDEGRLTFQGTRYLGFERTAGEAGKAFH